MDKTVGVPTRRDEPASGGKTLPEELAGKDRDRLSGYRELLDFYNGAQWLTQSRKERQLTFNYARVAIDKVTSYLMSGLDFAVEPVGGPSVSGLRSSVPGAAWSSLPSSTLGEGQDRGLVAARAAEDALYRVYRDNALEALDFETEVDAAILGDAAYKVTWDLAERRVRVTSPDVQGLWAWWRADDPSRVYRVAHQVVIPADQAQALYGHSGNVGAVREPPSANVKVVEDWTERTFTRWLSPSETPAQSGSEILPILSGSGPVHFTGPNPYGFIPYVIFPNLREPKKFWGLSDIPPIRETARELNRALSQLSRILEVSGNPIAVLENVEDSEDIAVQPNAVWNVPEGAKAYLLDLLQGGGVRLHVDYIDLLYRTLHDLAETPRAAFGGIERELSGVALEIELHPLLQKVRRKRTIRTAAYRRRAEMVLALLRKFDPAILGAPSSPDRAGISDPSHSGKGQGLGPSPYSIRIVWGQVLPQDKGRVAQNEQLLVQSGIHSRRRAMDDMGVMDPDREFSRWLEERGAIMEQNQRLSRPGPGLARESVAAPPTRRGNGGPRR
ncbi:MAG: phage portal protein [Chloroflexi bacterium]|nr:phage portal protein [Chloroflexota bacterium]